MGNHIINLNSLNNTDILARLIAKNLFPKAIVLLWGEMGSGKTTFANDLITDEGITIVEWPKLILSFLTDEPLINLKFETVSSYTRRVELESNFKDFDKIFTSLKKDNIFKNN